MSKPVPALRDNRPRPGRPTKATPATLATLTRAIATGLTDEQAADLAGIHGDTLRVWRKGDEGFSAALKKASALRLADRLARIEAGAPGWQATAWILDRSDRARWGPPKTTAALEHFGKDGGPIVQRVMACVAEERAE